MTLSSMAFTTDSRVVDLLLAGAAADVPEPVPSQPEQGAAEAGGTQVSGQGQGLQKCHGVG
jgi:hypothetical protein